MRSGVIIQLKLVLDINSAELAIFLQITFMCISMYNVDHYKLLKIFYLVSTNYNLIILVLSIISGLV